MSDQPANFAIVILNWNGLEDTIHCLESVYRIDYPRFTPIVVDNGSTDGSVVALRQRFSNLMIVENDENLGFAEGNNRGIEVALARGFDMVMLLNNDTVVDARILWALNDAAHTRTDMGIFAAKIFYHAQPQRIWYAGAAWEPSRASFRHIGHGRLDGADPQYDTPAPTAYACGCALAARARVFRDVGLLEPRYFLMYEETDFCYRAARAGHHVWFVPDAKVWHKISASFGGDSRGCHASYYAARNRLLWMQRNLGLRYGMKMFMRVVLRETVADALAALNPFTSPAARKVSRAKTRGFFDYCRRHFGRGPDWITG